MLRKVLPATYFLSKASFYIECFTIEEYTHFIFENREPLCPILPEQCGVFFASFPPTHYYYVEWNIEETFVELMKRCQNEYFANAYVQISN